MLFSYLLSKMVACLHLMLLSLSIFLVLFPTIISLILALLAQALLSAMPDHAYL